MSRPCTTNSRDRLVLVLSIGAISLLYLMIRHGELSRIAGLFYPIPAVTAANRIGETLCPCSSSEWR